MIRPLRFWRQYISTALIFTLLVSQTIRVDFFGEAQASQDKYRDIVSIVVDRDTYDAIDAEIKQYAEDIQTYLGSTRTSILVVDPDTAPAQIAAQNERLYYEGDGEEGTVSHLVGTILIGDIAIPMVDAGDEQFPSVYPYVDFVDKKFVYDEASKRYITAATDTQKIIEPEIWHGVINPAVGRTFEKVSKEADPDIAGSQAIVSDIDQISAFLDKTHEFYLGKGVFATSTIPPRVFHYDGYSEAQSFILQDLAAYKLYLTHAEELIYNRYSKYFLQYITDELEEDKAQFETEERAYLDSLGLGSPSLSDEFANTPDIQTKTMILALMKKFHELINKQALGEIRGFVRNAGRYNSGSEVRIDQPAINISLMDYSASNTIRKINDKFEKHIDEVEIGFFGPGQIGGMPPFSSTTINDPSDRISRTYDAYIFGKKVSEIDNIAQCNIARGSDYTTGPYKQGILVEANKAFDVRSTPESMENFKRDGEKRIDCAPTDDDQATYETDVYWGKNIITNVDTNNWIFKKPSQIGGYYDSIASLGGMNEVNNTNGVPRLNHEPGAPYNELSTITPLHTRDCYGGGMAYALQAPRGDAGGDIWPEKESGEEAGPPGITCLTKQEEKSQPTWRGNSVPYAGKYPPHEFDWIANATGPGDDPNSFAPAKAGPKGICEHGQISMYLAPKEYFSGASVSPVPTDFVYACLPGTGDKYTLQPGELVSQKCLPDNLDQYLQQLLDETGGSPSGVCPLTNPLPGKLYSTACSILGDARNAAPEKGNWKNDYEKNIPRINGSLFNSPCAGLAAVQILNGRPDPAHPVLNLCMAVEKPLAGGGEASIFRKEDLTTYETAIFKDIDDSRVFHKSPTDEELNAAEKGTTTPSLPIDHDRYLTFSHTVGGEWTMQYPNLFRFDEQAIMEKYSKTGILKRDAGGGVIYPVEPVTDSEVSIPRSLSGTVLYNSYNTNKYILTALSNLPDQLSGATGSQIRATYPVGTEVYMIAHATGANMPDATQTGWTLPIGDTLLNMSGVIGAYRVSRVIGFETPTYSLSALAATQLPGYTGATRGRMTPFPTSTGAIVLRDIAYSPGSRFLVDQYGSGVYLITPVKTAPGILTELPSTTRGKELIKKYGSGAYLIAAYRYHLNDLGVLAWGGIKPGGAILTSTPPEPPCWGGALGANVDKCIQTLTPADRAHKDTYDPIYGVITDDEIASVIRSKRWLHPDVTLKYQQAIETGLSYSRQYGLPDNSVGDIATALTDIPTFLSSIDGAVTGPPKIPTMIGGYEIAYLGLTQFIPKGEGDEGDRAITAGGKSVAGLATDYADSRAALTALNISEQDAEDGKDIAASPSDACGPPEGVSLFQWPSAIQCWIKSLTPLRIVGQACTTNSIGLDAGIFANTRFSGVSGGIASLPIVSPTPDKTSTRASLAVFYTGANLTYHLSRDVILPNETIDVRFLYTKNSARLTVPSGSTIRLDIESITDIAGNIIDSAKYGDYLSVAPNPTTLTENGATFVIEGREKIGKISLRAKMDIRAADSSIYTVTSDTLVVRVSDEYLVTTPSVAGKLTSMIAVTSLSGMLFDFGVRNMSGDTLAPAYPITLDIYDDVRGTRIATGITIPARNYALPTEYTKTTGVLRLEFRDNKGRHSTDTIAVQAGPIARASFAPISSALLMGSDTLVTLRMRDALGNPVAPDLHSIDVTAVGGYFILEGGEKKTSMHIDAIESEIPLTVGSDVPGEIQLQATIDTAIRTDIVLTVFESARMIISRTGTPQVGGDTIPVTVRIVGADNMPIRGFRSVLSLALPSGAGTFSPQIATITDGLSEPITYTPGRLAGVHHVRTSVPGLSAIPDIDFSVDAGQPMYISHTEDDTYMTFSLRDRYDNIVPVSLTGTLELGGSTPAPIVFASGILSVEKKTGYMIVEVPALSNNAITYTDSEGDHTIRGISIYTAWITSLNKKFNFTADYNARYTVLAGGAFLREGEDILYNTTPGQSSSLAVTTLLDSPYKQDTLMSISPGGGFSLTDAADSLPEATLILESGYPLLTVGDAVSSSIITRALYQANDATIDTCIGTGCLGSLVSGAHIRLESSASGYVVKQDGEGIILMKDAKTLLSVDSAGKITTLPGVTLQVDVGASSQTLTIDIFSGGEQVARLYYKTDSQIGINHYTDRDTFIVGNTVTLDQMTPVLIEPFSLTRLADSVTGYRFIKKGLTPTINEEKNGPEAIESLAMTSETPGIGWQGTNRMLLSYAGGDSVGEASKWFHTYTLVNLGDPVAHNDRKALGTELDGIDRSLGTELTSPQASPVKSYAQKDMDKDGYDDIVVQHTDGYIELLLNLGDRMRSRGNIAHIPDITSRGISLGDFTADGYADILGVDKQGVFTLLSNDQRQFTRQKLSVTSGATVPSGVTQFQIRDMDGDLRDDITYLTDGGELSILYGTTRPGIFDKKILDATLGLSLSATPIKTGGALFASHIPQVSLSSTSTDGTLDESLIWNEVYVPYTSAPSRQTTTVDTSEAGALTALDDYFAQVKTDPNASQSTDTKNFIRSEYASAQGMEISKRYSLGSGTTLTAGQRIRVDIDIRNTRTSPATALEYLDTIPQIFSTEKTLKYTIRTNGNTVTRDFAITSSSDYDTYFTLPDIAAGQMSTISYELTALPTSYGELLIGDYEQGETGADAYMDVGFKTATTCGADMMLWRSDAIARNYTKGTRSFSDATFSSTVAAQLADTNHDGFPDSVADMTPAGQQAILDNLTHTPGTAPSDGGGFMKGSVKDNGDFEIGFDEGFVDEVEGYAKEITDGLSGCGSNGGNTCINYPVNWAPLAPGGDPVAFGFPIGDGFRVSEGLPLFSSMTRIDYGPIPYVGCWSIPAIWPTSALSATSLGACTTNTIAATTEVATILASAGQSSASINLGAGGMLGTTSPLNTLRIYATPTLTMGVGVAICQGGPAQITPPVYVRTGLMSELITPGTGFGWTPPPGAWPAIPGGNCIVVAKNINMCKNDGSIEDGDIRNVVGLGSTRDTWNAGNGSNAPGGTSAGSCNIVAQTNTVVQDQAFAQDVISYARAPDKGRLPALYKALSTKTPRTSASAGPLLSLNGATADGAAASVDISIDLAKPLTFDNIVKLNNKRISGFPDFLMDWVSRQTDELVNSLFTPPSLIIIPPTSIGQNAQFDGTLSGLTSTFKKSYEENSLSNIATAAGKAYDDASKPSTTPTPSATSTSTATSELGKWVQEGQSKLQSMQDGVMKGELGKLADKGKGGLAGIRAAYKLVGKLPLITISEKTVPVDVPWILPSELDQYARSLDAYSKEVTYMLDSFCVNDPSPDCLAQKAQIQSSGLIGSINENLKRIEEYKSFPIKLQKYITWKQRYLGQILCYITTIQEMTTGWLKDNSIRFKKWAELIVLMRSIAEAWQVILDIINEKDAQCAVCHNERYNAKNWKYKIISMLIPSIPIIQFPRWPDIVLDLSDIRLAILISMPNFQFNLKPIRLPALPSLTLPRGPNVSLTLPSIPVLPPIPNLPDLPDLPALPTIKLPNLPPPPKLPKISGALSGIVKILKLYKMIECYINKTPYVPEWTVGDVIAQRTERQGTNPLDFIDISLPQISIPTIKEIKISTHVNFEIRSDFVTEFARAAVAPLNKFGADLGRSIPSKIAPDVNLSTPTNINLNNLQSAVPTGSGSMIDRYIAELEREKDTLLDTDEFATYLISELNTNPELKPLSPIVTDSMRTAAVDAKKETDELLAYHTSRYDLLRDYVSAQYDETANMQHIIDLLTTETHTLSLTDMDRVLMVSDTLSTRSSILAREFNEQTELALAASTEDHPTDSLRDVADDLSRRVARLTANSTTSSAGDAIDTAVGYTPNFQGIYILTEKGTQTRLFDYTETLQKTDVSTKVDIDRDGDMDYLYILDGALFLKRTSTKEPTHTVDRTIRMIDVDAESPFPTAPDFFHEGVSVPGTLSLSYNASTDVESVWRVDFYDRYIEWDMLDQGDHDEEETPRQIVELYRQDLGGPSSPEKAVLRSLDRVADPSTLIIEGPKMHVLTGAMDFVLSPGRTLYTGNRAVTIRYATGTDTIQIEKILEPHRGYSFADLTNVSLDSGTLYIVYPSIVSEQYTYSDALRGMPILPGMRITSAGGEVILRDLVHDDDIIISPRALYLSESITRIADEYSVEIPYPNGYYYARIQSLDARGMTTARETLFTPQASSDTSAPDLDIRDTIRVPVYQARDIPLQSIITETNPYTLSIDIDVSQDSDGNGVYDDDFVTAALGISVTPTTLTLGSYDTIGKRDMMFQVVDEYRNTTILPVSVEVYAPIPFVSGMTASGVVSGGVAEGLLGEPIHLFRVRPGTEIRKLHTGALLTASGGLFQSSEFSRSTGATLSSSGQRISLSDRGIFGALPSGYSSRVVLADKQEPLHIDILDLRGVPVYRQMMVLPENPAIIEGSVGTGTDTLILTPAVGYTLVSASVSDPSIPGGYYLVGADTQAVFAVARDGNIYPTATGITATFVDKNGYPNLVISSGGKEVAEVLYKFDFFYTLK